MLAKVIAVLSLVFLVDVSSMSMMIDRCDVIEYILNMDVRCSGLVTIFDEEYSEENEKDISKLILKKERPLTLLQNHNGRVIVSADQQNSTRETVCSDAILFIQNLGHFPLIYEQVNDYFHAKKIILVTSNSSKEAEKLLDDIRNDNVYLLIERSQRFLEIYRWAVSDRIQKNVVFRHSNLKKILPVQRQTLMGRHLTIATLDFPPIVFAKTNEFSGKVVVYGIEPTIMEILAERLDFQVSYILPVNDEMWVSVAIHVNHFS